MIADFAARPARRRPSNNAFIAVGQKARELSDAKLVVAEAIGFGGALAVAVWNPRALELAFLSVAIGALGIWGIADHMLESKRRASAPVKLVLRGLRFSVGATGIAAALASGYALIGRLMGVFIL